MSPWVAWEPDNDSATAYNGHLSLHEPTDGTHQRPHRMRSLAPAMARPRPRVLSRGSS